MHHTCPFCSRLYAVTKSGQLRAHGGHGSPRTYCKGSRTIVSHKGPGRPKQNPVKFQVIVHGVKELTHKFSNIRDAYPFFEECVAGAAQNVKSVTLTDLHEVLAYAERRTKTLMVPVI